MYRGRAAFSRKAWEEALRAAEIDDFHFHDLLEVLGVYHGGRQPHKAWIELFIDAPCGFSTDDLFSYTA